MYFRIKMESETSLKSEQRRGGGVMHTFHCISLFLHSGKGFKDMFELIVVNIEVKKSH